MAKHAAPPQGRRAATHQWWALATLTIPVLLLSIDLTVLSMAVPHLSEDLAPTSTQLLWIIDIYGVFLAGLLVPIGSLGDRIGRRRLLLIGAVAFGAASILAAFAWNAEILIVARALLGVGGAALMPSTLSMIRTIFTDPAQRRSAIAVWTAAFAGGSGLGPVIGGVLLEHFWWGSVFLITVPIMMLLLIAGPLLLLPESKDPNPGAFDPLSVLLLISAILTVIFGLKHAGEYGWGPVPITCLLAGLGLAVVFTRRQRGLAQPLIDVALFRSLPFSMAVLANVAGVFALTGMLYFYPQYLQIVLGQSPLQAGLWTLPLAVGAIMGALTAPALARRLPVGWVVGLGLGAASIGYLLLSLLGTDESMAMAFVAGALLGGGAGTANTLTNDVIIGTAPADKAGAAAGISETAYELGGAMGTAVLGSIGASLYSGSVTADLPSGISAEISETAAQTIGAAAHLAAALPSGLADPFLAVVKTAFVEAMTQTFLTAAVIVATTALGVILALRTYRSTAPTDH